MDEFYSLVEVNNGGYSLNWGRDATLTFPVFKDADGDMLMTRAKGGNDPDDSLFDSDHDGLSDYDEISYGTNPRLFDSDDDGLYDIDEMLIGTDANRKDSDGDGLTDDLEVQGWFFTYGFYMMGLLKRQWFIQTRYYPTQTLMVLRIWKRKSTDSTPMFMKMPIYWITASVIAKWMLQSCCCRWMNSAEQLYLRIFRILNLTLSVMLMPVRSAG